MEEKKKIKVSLKTAVILVIILIMIIAAFVALMININKRKMVNNTLVATNPNGYEKNEFKGYVSYTKINEKTWGGIYHKDAFQTEKAVDDIMEVVTYEKYKDIIKSINSVSQHKIKQYYINENCNYIVLILEVENRDDKMNLIDCMEDKGKIIIYGNIYGKYSFCVKNCGYIIAIPTNLPVGTEIEYRRCSDKSKGIDVTQTIDKPIIYLYPTEETNVTVKLLKSKNLTCSYPKYEDGWNVLAEPNGDLKDLTTNRNLYSLYYESESEINFKVEDEGFVIKGEDSAKFLEEKLAILGLNEREAEEFIVYWLPRLEANKYNYIRFATSDEINQNMPLEISPKPDSTIRVLMIFKGLESPIDVNEQKLTIPNRTGFVTVEWGGTEIK